MNELVLQMKGISKRFPSVVALANVDFDLRKGEIHALLGENGAGKTTLMKILFGILRNDSGEIYINGNRARISSPNDARSHGIGMVHQHFMLVDSFTMIENIALGYNNDVFVAHGAIERKIEEISSHYSLSVDPDKRIWELSVGEQQRVEIIKALYGDVEILILDEPTTVLTPLEVRDLFKAIRNMKQRGKSVVFITHKLDEVMDIADRVTVLRKGNLVGVVRPDQTTKSDLIKMMIGKDISETTKAGKIKEITPSETPLLEVDSLVVINDKGQETLHQISFKVYPGEILGVAGVAGNGQKEMAEVLVGVRDAQKGRIRFLGKDITGGKTRNIMNLGISLVPENKIKEGIFPNLSVMENLLITNHDDIRFSNGFTIDYSSFEKTASGLANDFNIMAPSMGGPARTLSGGNLQKLLVARTMVKEPKLIIMSNPTSGLDVASVSFLHDLLIKMKNSDVGILLVSEDLDEIMQLSDRIVVLRDGKISGDFRGDVNVSEVAVAMTTKAVT